MWPLLILGGLYLAYRYLEAHPFKHGAQLVAHPLGQVLAVPNDTPILPPGTPGSIVVVSTSGPVSVPASTPIMHPADAAQAGMLSPSATMTFMQAMNQGIKAPRQLLPPPPPPPSGMSGAGSAGTAALGDWQMFDPARGVGPDVAVDQYGIPRQDSFWRPFSAR